MRPTAELRLLRKEYLAPFEGAGVIFQDALQQKWVQHHIPTGQTEAPFEWRDIPIVKDEK